MEGRYMDTENYDALAFRIRGDGRKYIANLRTANWIVGEDKSHDVWQAFLLARCVICSSSPKTLPLCLRP